MPSVIRINAEGLVERREDRFAPEEPLEIRLSGETLAITMRTPGNDRELVVGFLLAEGVITSRNDISKLTHCGRIGDESRTNTMEVTLAPGVRPPTDPETGLLARRGTLTSSACGVCGRRSIDDLLDRLSPLPVTLKTSRAAIAQAMADLQSRQPIFKQTGGCHAAVLVSADEVVSFEDIGRHNAVDKVIGSRVLAGATCEGILAVSGRSSFEIVQKAFAAGIPIVASVSAPSSLAVDLAQRAGITLAGFVRDGSMSIYAGGERVLELSETPSS